MAYDLKLAERVRSKLNETPFVEKKMFGGVGFLLNGNTPALPICLANRTDQPGRCAPGASVACGVNKDNLIVCIDPEKQNTLLKKPHAKPFELTGKPMKGWLVVEADGVKTDKQLRTWVKEGLEFALTLPPK